MISNILPTFTSLITLPMLSPSWPKCVAQLAVAQLDCRPVGLSPRWPYTPFRHELQRFEFVHLHTFVHAIHLRLTNALFLTYLFTSGRSWLGYDRLTRDPLWPSPTTTWSKPPDPVIATIRLRFDGRSTAYQRSLRSQWRNTSVAADPHAAQLHLGPQCGGPHTEVDGHRESNGGPIAVESKSNRTVVTNALPTPLLLMVG